MNRPLLLLLAPFLAALPLSAAVLIVNTPVNTTIPDDSSTGLFSQISVATEGTVDSISVGLNISPAIGSTAFLGDLYAYLQHDSGLSVLLNRPGRRTGETLGYDDNQSLSVTFSDAGTGDIHSYRTVLSGNDAAPLASALTGTWIPDGRTTDPSLVLATDNPSARLTVFDGANLQGNWRMFVADISGGALHRFDSWSLTVNYSPVPEPAAGAVLAALGLVTFAFFRRSRRSSRQQNGEVQRDTSPEGSLLRSEPE